MQSETASIVSQAEEESDRLRIQPFITEDTHLILRTAAAIQNCSFGKIIDQWAQASKERQTNAA